ncbi:MAG: hypothetical protein KDB53_09530, partial [Planctomycetes bacterium]|nr:hypothetical protein [Planctomycetota bacterium]
MARLSQDLRNARRRGLILFGILFAFSACGGDESTTPHDAPKPEGLIYLHRGARLEAPEGTMPCLQATHRQGADGIEIDLRRTLDGVLVNYHDDDTFLHGDGFLPVEAISYAEFRSLDMGAWYGRAFRGAVDVDRKRTRLNS